MVSTVDTTSCFSPDFLTSLRSFILCSLISRIASFALSFFHGNGKSPQIKLAPTHGMWRAYNLIFASVLSKDVIPHWNGIAILELTRNHSDDHLPCSKSLRP